VPVNVGSFWTSISLNQFSQRIKKLVLVRPPVSDTARGHIYIDNFQFTPVTTVSPEGFLDGVNLQQAKAFGWSRDPDNLSAANFVDCYVDGMAGQGTPIGRVTANIASPDVGNHRFEIAIPTNFRDGNNHQLFCYGIDIAGGDPNAQLGGSPKTFKFNTPIGNFDGIDADGNASGWSSDPDLPNQPNTIHFYLNAPAGSPGSEYVGLTVADNYRMDVGNHGFNFSIPAQYRDGAEHRIYAHGIDLTGDLNKLLGGNPKTFNIT
jgi:hypothetical protein